MDVRRFLACRGTGFRLSAFLLLGLGAAVAAQDPLTMIPADAAGVIVLRDLGGAAERLGKFLAQLDPNRRPPDVGLLEETLDCPRGTWDTRKPVAIVLTQPTTEFFTNPEFSETSALFAFTPRDPRAFAESLGLRGGAVHRVELLGRRYYAFMRNDVVFCGGKRRAVRLVRRVTPQASMAAALSADQKALYERSDLFLHLPMREWRDRVGVLALVATNMTKLGLANQKDPKLMQAGMLTLDWLNRGFQAVARQMQSLTVAGSFDGRQFELVHLHTFEPGGSIAEYLQAVKRSDGDDWASLPDQPFCVVGVFNWHCPPQYSISARLTCELLGADFLNNETPADVQAELLDTTNAWYGQTWGSCFMVTSRQDRSSALEVLGCYRMEDAEKGIEQAEVIQQAAGELTSQFLGGAYGGKPVRRQKGGVTYYETRFDADSLPPMIRHQLLTLYGAGAGFQQAVAGREHLAYIVSARPDAIVELLNNRSTGPRLADAPRVRRVLESLPKDANGVIVCDAARCFAQVPRLIQASAGERPVRSLWAGKTVTPRPQDVSTTEPSRPSMIAWACVVRGDSLSGHLVVPAEDAAETVRQVGRLGRTLESVFEVAGSQP